MRHYTCISPVASLITSPAINELLNVCRKKEAEVPRAEYHFNNNAKEERSRQLQLSARARS